MHIRSLTIILLAAVAIAAAGQQRGKSYLQADDLPNAVNYLPPPPDSTSAQFAYDMSRYYWGKSMRNTARGRLAVEDADLNTSHLLRVFNGPMGLSRWGVSLSKYNTPALYTLIRNSLATCDASIKPCKKHYARVRPFKRFGEPLATGETLNDGAYPSGHTARAWLMALLLVELNPAAAEPLMQRAYEFGQSRVIVGAHWQSDVDAGRVAASVCLARLHSDAAFQAEFEAAREELARLTAHTSIADAIKDNRDTMLTAPDGQVTTDRHTTEQRHGTHNE